MYDQLSEQDNEFAIDFVDVFRCMYDKKFTINYIKETNKVSAEKTTACVVVAKRPVSCGHCGHKHESVSMVRECSIKAQRQTTNSSQRQIKCVNCGSTHESVQALKSCFGF